MTDPTPSDSAPDGETILITDDDKAFCAALSGAFRRRGFKVVVAHDYEDALSEADAWNPARAVVDLRMPGRGGLEVVGELKQKHPAMKVVVLTGYGSIATAVGLGGAGLAMAGLFQSQAAQDEVEGLGGDPANQPRIDELDDEGARANQMAYIGIGVAAAGLAIGIPLIIVGAKKRREAGPSANASVRVAPMVAGRVQGLAVAGRF